MKRFWNRSSEFEDVESRLRDERPEPSDELVRRISDDVDRSTPRLGAPRLRLGAAVTVSAAMLAVVIALGGVGGSLDAATGVIQADNAGNSSKDKDKGKPSHDQYDEKVTICHRPPGNPSNGQTLRLPRSAAEAHLRNHPYDSRGACSSPSKVTICHREAYKQKGRTYYKSQSLRLYPWDADDHLKRHKSDKRGAC